MGIKNRVSSHPTSRVTSATAYFRANVPLTPSSSQALRNPRGRSRVPDGA
ncbi:hypothetical protein ACU8KH_00851 [Lachancea thermotolerans]